MHCHVLDVWGDLFYSLPFTITGVFNMSVALLGLCIVIHFWNRSIRSYRSNRSPFNLMASVAGEGVYFVIATWGTSGSIQVYFVIALPGYGGWVGRLK